MLHLSFDAIDTSTRALEKPAPLRRGVALATHERGVKAAQIRFRTVPCSIGFLLVAATPKGLCSVALGDSEEQLIASLHQEFPVAEMQSEDAQLQVWTESLVAHLAGHEPQLDLPLDVKATVFQGRVWQILRSINYGDTRSYSQVAEMLGQPQAVRAVARACATNPVALVVPCHRVVRSDGSLGGFRWGLERKQALLAQERRSL